MHPNHAFQTHMLRAVLRLTVLMFGPGAIAGRTLAVTNISEGELVLSDLVLYGDGPQTITILATGDSFPPAGGATPDDITMEVGATRAWDAGFDITGYNILIAKVLEGRRSEYDSSDYFRVLKIKLIGIQKLGYFETSDTHDPLFAAFDDGHALDSPASGTTFEILVGLNATLPGWFFGTALDISTGEVTGSYSGRASVVFDRLEVRIVPGPAPWALLCLAMIAVQIAPRVRRSGARIHRL